MIRLPWRSRLEVPDEARFAFSLHCHNCEHDWKEFGNIGELIENEDHKLANGVRVDHGAGWVEGIGCPHCERPERVNIVRRWKVNA